MKYKNTNTAYIMGVAIGDGNLSNPNGRATRLRITCDDKYPKLIQHITKSLQILLPHNKVSHYRRKENYTDVYVYSNVLEKIFVWKALGGPKHIQHVQPPRWIMNNKTYMDNVYVACLRRISRFIGIGNIFMPTSQQLFPN